MSSVQVPEAPDIPGLKFRRLIQPDDYPHMVEIVAASRGDDGIDYSETVEDIARQYRHLCNCDVKKDALFAEVDGDPIGYARLWFTITPEKSRKYHFFVNLKPDWRGKGIRTTILRWCESRIREIRGTEPHDNDVIFIWAMEPEEHWCKLLESEGYEIVRYYYRMVRPDLENIPDCKLPPALEIRPVRPEDERKIWDADVEASKDGWGWVEPQEEWFQSYKESKFFQPEIWQVAWDGDRVAGAVQNFIDHDDNLEFNRKWGWTENIHVGREWRGKGVAKALIASSFRVLKEQGMDQAVLGVDVQNPTGALHLYMKMGFKETRRAFAYQKKL